MTAPESPAALLRQAAAHLDRLDQDATPAPWRHIGRNQIQTPGIDVDEANWGGTDDNGDQYTDYQLVCLADSGAWRKADAAFTAALRPVAAPLAAALLDLADLVEMGHFADPRRVERFAAMARAALGEADGGEPRG